LPARGAQRAGSPRTAGAAGIEHIPGARYCFGQKGTVVTFQRVEGTDKGKIILYTLSTCMWCRMAKNLLHDLGVGYAYIDVDTLPTEEKAEVKKEIKRWNPEGSYPTIIINDNLCVSGFDETEIREKIK
jgi:glutaredoxin-like protein NrdH